MSEAEEVTATDAATLTGFSHVIAALRQQADHFTIALPSDWLQGRTAYGGLSAALCLQATLRSFPDLPPRRSAQFAFVGPATGMLRVTAIMLRQGKSTAFTSAEVHGENRLAARATFCFGAERSLVFNHAQLPAPTALLPSASSSYFDWPGKPNFMNHFDGRLAAGARPGTPGFGPEMLVWLRHRDEKTEGGLVSLLALADALPPAATILFPKTGTDQHDDLVRRYARRGADKPDGLVARPVCSRNGATGLFGAKHVDLEFRGQADSRRPSDNRDLWIAVMRARVHFERATRANRAGALIRHPGQAGCSACRSIRRTVSLFERTQTSFKEYLS